MGLPVDTSTVLLLLAPLFLPKLYGLGAQAVANFTKKPGKGSSASHIRQQAEKAHIRQRFGLTSTPALILAAYSAYFLAFGRPFNYFISLGNVPVTAPVSKIQAALAWRGLADKYAEDLNVLISLDLRALYMHFGHVNLVGCYRLLGSVAPKDVLAYSSIQLARSYILRVLVLSYSNRRWKNTILIASIAAFLYEVYSLAATDMRLPTQPAETQSHYEYLVFWRNVGFLCASIITLLLPSKVPAKPLSPEESALVQAVHALIQRQDMLQTRIRVVESTMIARNKSTLPLKSTSHLSIAQKASLKAWLRTIMETNGNHISNNQPFVKAEEVSQEVTIPSVKFEEVELPENGLQIPKSESLNIVDESFATAPVIIKRSSSEESLMSPSLSRSSSSSTPIDTPTPAMRRPMSMEISTGAAAQLKEMLQKDDQDADEDGDQPLNKRFSLTNRLTQSLGPAGPLMKSDMTVIDHEEEERHHRRSFSMFDAVPQLPHPTSSLPLNTTVNGPASTVAEDLAHANVETVDILLDQVSLGPDVTVEGAASSTTRGGSPHLPSEDVSLSLVEALQLPENEMTSSEQQASQARSSQPAPVDDGSRTIHPIVHVSSSKYTPTSTATVSEDEGWTTVLSKKTKHKTQ